MLTRRRLIALVASSGAVTALVLSGLVVQFFQPQDGGTTVSAAAVSDAAPPARFLAAYPAPATPTPSPTPTSTVAAYPAPGQKLFFPILESNGGASGSVDWNPATPTPVGTPSSGTRR